MEHSNLPCAQLFLVVSILSSLELYMEQLDPKRLGDTKNCARMALDQHSGAYCPKVYHATYTLVFHEIHLCTLGILLVGLRDRSLAHLLRGNEVS